jgi:hypothetical protein
MTFHIQSKKFSEYRPYLMFYPPDFVNSTIMNILNPNLELIGHHPRSVNLFWATINFIVTKSLKIDFFDR